MKTERKLTTLIIDDEAPARDIIRHYLRNHPSVEIIGEYADGFTGLKAIQDLRPDLVILDIQMPRLTGLEILELLDEWPAVIFVTAYDRYAIRAFELSAVDYLLKPFSEERLKEAVDKAVKRTGGRNAGDEVQALMNAAREQVKHIERLVVKAGSRIHILSLDDIRYFEAVDDYVKIHTEKERYMKKMTMKYLEDRLDGKEFIRIHRSYIVAVKEIRSIEKYGRESYLALLHGGEKLSMSQGGMERLKEAMML
ncbi:MAG TPA: response regulator [Bacteroidetes bacterium]|nr:response regulator [Bacteroidota bacterium]